MQSLSNLMQKFVACAMERQECLLIDRAGRIRIVEPYMVYISARGLLCYHAYQIDGFSRSDERRGWKNPQVSDIADVRPNGNKFGIRREYNPSNRKMFRRVRFSLPDATGWQRDSDLEPIGPADFLLANDWTHDTQNHEI